MDIAVRETLRVTGQILKLSALFDVRDEAAHTKRGSENDNGMVWTVKEVDKFECLARRVAFNILTELRFHETYDAPDIVVIFILLSRTFFPVPVRKECARQIPWTRLNAYSSYAPVRGLFAFKKFLKKIVLVPVPFVYLRRCMPTEINCLCGSTALRLHCFRRRLVCFTSIMSLMMGTAQRGLRGLSEGRFWSSLARNLTNSALHSIVHMLFGTYLATFSFAGHISGLPKVRCLPTAQCSILMRTM